MNLQEIAQRNRADRMAQLARLAPIRHQAKQRAESLYNVRQGTKVLRQDLEVMQRLRHIPNFFPTPRKLVEKMIEIAELSPGMTVLEPSAGKGNIAIAARASGAVVTCIEKIYTLAEHLRGLGFDCQCSDFLECHPDPRLRLKFDRVIMNPPFERGIDEDHVLHAVKFLRPEGRLIAIVSASTAQRMSLSQFPYSKTDQLPDGTFALSERPTQVRTALITIHI